MSHTAWHVGAYALALVVVHASACSSRSDDETQPVEVDLGAKSGDVGKKLDHEPSREPVAGVDVSALDDKQLERWYLLVDRLASPCQKPHSLRYSITRDTSCKRAPFAARYVVMLIADGVDDDAVDVTYRNRYGPGTMQELAHDESVPRYGPADALVTMVEFYDYGCPKCKQAAPPIGRVARHFAGQVALYYRQFPLSTHVNSRIAARAALAAHAQGKFEEMHRVLFENAPRHELAALLRYAQVIGLDMQRFQADFETADAIVEADRAAGAKAGVRSTPTLFINGRRYHGPYEPDKYLMLWVEEEIAVNQ